MTTSMMRLPDNLPSVAHAKLPEKYQLAKAALAAAERIDECLDWADQVMAMASYARQADDDTLIRHCNKIRARAIERCGELLRAIKDQPGKRTDKQPGVVDSTRLTRTQVARAAGMTPAQQVQAMRVSAIPKAQFEALVESDDPPTVTELADMGRKARPKILDIGDRDPEDVSISTDAQGLVRRLAELSGDVDAGAVVRGAFKHELQPLAARSKAARDWLNSLITEIGKAK